MLTGMAERVYVWIVYGFVDTYLQLHTRYFPRGYQLSKCPEM
jgi:hypothetical protein